MLAVQLFVGVRVHHVVPGQGEEGVVAAGRSALGQHAVFFKDDHLHRLADEALGQLLALVPALLVARPRSRNSCPFQVSARGTASGALALSCWLHTLIVSGEPAFVQSLRSGTCTASRE